MPKKNNNSSNAKNPRRRQSRGGKSSSSNLIVSPSVVSSTRIVSQSRPNGNPMKKFAFRESIGKLSTTEPIPDELLTSEGGAVAMIVANPAFWGSSRAIAAIGCAYAWRFSRLRVEFVPSLPSSANGQFGMAQFCPGQLPSTASSSVYMQALSSMPGFVNVSANVSNALIVRSINVVDNPLMSLYDPDLVRTPVIALVCTGITIDGTAYYGKVCDIIVDYELEVYGSSAPFHYSTGTVPVMHIVDNSYVSHFCTIFYGAPGSDRLSSNLFPTSCRMTPCLRMKNATMIAPTWIDVYSMMPGCYKHCSYTSGLCSFLGDPISWTAMGSTASSITISGGSHTILTDVAMFLNRRTLTDFATSNTCSSFWRPPAGAWTIANLLYLEIVPNLLSPTEMATPVPLLSSSVSVSPEDTETKTEDDVSTTVVTTLPTVTTAVSTIAIPRKKPFLPPISNST